ncbi:MAG: Ppx/GppA family phosphatase, partial [Methylocella sp.]
MSARGASPHAGAGAVRGAGLTGRSAANDVAGASVRALADRRRQEHIYAALDLGTNNCRLLIARAAPAGSGDGDFRVIDSFSRIVRLGEGLSRTGEL